MKLRLFIIISLLCAVKSASAQFNANHLLVGGGISYRNGLEATLAFEHTTSYHNSWEYFVNGYVQYEKDPEYGHINHNSLFHNYRSWLLGIAYKPCMVRGRNQHGNLRIGVIAGSDFERFIGGGTIGYEQTFALHKDWEIFFQVKEDVLFRAKDTFRTGVSIGIKIPIN